MSEDLILKAYAKAWDRTTAEDIRVGAAFYPAYQSTLRRFADFYKTDFEPTVSAFVALSPRNHLSGNLRGLATLQWALHHRRLNDVTGFRKFRDRAMLYLTRQARFEDLAKGRKITAFRDNLLNPITSKLPCIDGHMICIGLGKDMSMIEALFASRDHGLRAYERALQRLCAKTRLPVPSTQAILWTARQRAQNPAYLQSDLFAGGSLLDGALCPRDFPPYGYDKTWQLWASARKEGQDVPAPCFTWNIAGPANQP